MNTPHSPAPADGTDAAALLGAVRDLRDAVADTDVPTDSAAAADARAVVNQFDDYILPRLSNLDAPLLAVIGGSTGSGKSTLVNGVLQEHVSNPGVIRPTTRQPILVANPANADWFNSPEVLPGLARSHGAGDEQSTTLRIVRTEQIPEGLALVDAPDFDSIDDHNRALASQLLAAADLWIFVTTPARYADQLVWNFLNDAAGRGIEVVVVLNRLDESSAETVPADLRRMMDQAGLTGATVFTVPFVTGTDEFLPNEVVAPLRDYLSTLANDTAARRDVAGKTVAGALAGALGRVDKLTAAREQQEAFANQLDAAISEQYRAASQHVIEATSDGKLLRTEVMDRWQDVVGTSDVFRGVERWFSQAVDKVGSFFTGQPAPLREVETEIETGLHAVLIDAAETAAARSWSHVGTVAPELRAQADPSLARASATVSDDAARLVRDWQQAMLERIQDTAGQKRQRARAMSLGLNVLTVALMLVVFASTAGLTGGEVAIAGGSAVVGQKMLETIFGEDTVRRMAAEAKADLNERLEVLMEAERNRYRDVTAPLHRGATADQLREAAGQARAQASVRFPEALPAPANLPAVAGGEGGVDKQQSSGEADSKLRGLLDQLRGTFTRPDGQDGGTDGAV
ncbi:GTPase domain-containing protein [Corynebacterium hadale]|uniref:GTPase domain-containing protein n=1 Tax=Corynebacterium hadale TaxID=2026255 RepID=UPI001EF3C00A|nr:GTPase domain-containing protein [Corynebacterium hadale]MCG7256763.1 GTPase domain-containing protein [Corynebacterium hadale]MCG7265389.1 GTPase domain-containing protein [Corynebacterium hadale]